MVSVTLVIAKEQRAYYNIDSTKDMQKDTNRYRKTCVNSSADSIRLKKAQDTTLPSWPASCPPPRQIRNATTKKFIHQAILLGPNGPKAKSKQNKTNIVEIKKILGGKK